MVFHNFYAKKSRITASNLKNQCSLLHYYKLRACKEITGDTRWLPKSDFTLPRALPQRSVLHFHLAKLAKSSTKASEP